MDDPQPIQTAHLQQKPVARCYDVMPEHFDLMPSPSTQQSQQQSMPTPPQQQQQQQQTVTSLPLSAVGHGLQLPPDVEFSSSRLLTMGNRSESSSDVLRMMYDSIVDRYEALKRDHDKLRQLYDDMLATMNAETIRYNAKCQENTAIKEEMASLRLQCSAAIHKWNGLFIENGELTDQLAKANALLDDKRSEMNRVTSAKDDEIIAVQSEKEELLSEHRLLMSERDTVLKEIDQLHDRLNESIKKIQTLEAEKRKLHDQVVSLHEEITSAMQDRDRALRDANELRQRYGDVVCEKEEAKLEISAFRSHLDMLTQERNAARQERLEAIKNYERILQETYEFKEKAESKELASKEAETLRRDLEMLRRDLADAREEAVVAKMRRDWAFSERDKIVLERESVRRQCDELRRERDRAVSSHADVLRELDELKKYKLDAAKQLKDLRDIVDSQERKNCFSPDGTGQHSSRDSAIDADMQDCDMETLEVELDSDQLYSLNIDVCCPRGDGTGDSPAFISSISKSASCDGKLKVNDVLLRVNDLDLNQEGIRRETILDALRTACGATVPGVGSSSVRLMVRRRRQQHSHVTLNVNRKDAGIQIEQGLYISKIDRSLAAARDGLIAVGDRLLYVNHKSVENKSIKEVVKWIDGCRDYLTLTICKCRHVTSDFVGSTSGSTAASSTTNAASPSLHKAHTSVPLNGFPLYGENVHGGPKKVKATEPKAVSAFLKIFGGRHKHGHHQRDAPGGGSCATDGSDQSDNDDDTLKLARSTTQPPVLDSLEVFFGHGAGSDGSDTWPKYRQPVVSTAVAAMDGTPPHGTLTVRGPRKERPGIPAEWLGSVGGSGSVPNAGGGAGPRAGGSGCGGSSSSSTVVGAAGGNGGCIGALGVTYHAPGESTSIQRPRPVTSSAVDRPRLPGGTLSMSAVSPSAASSCLPSSPYLTQQQQQSLQFGQFPPPPPPAAGFEDETQRYHSRSNSQVESLGPGRYASLPSAARGNPVPFDKLDKSKSLDCRRQRPESMHMIASPSLSVGAFSPLGGGGSVSFPSGQSVPGGLGSLAATSNAPTAASDPNDALSSEFNKNVLKLKQQANRLPGQGRGRPKRETPPGHAPPGRTRELQKPASLNLHSFVNQPQAISPIFFDHGRYSDTRPPSSPFGKAVPSPTLLSQSFAPPTGTAMMGFSSSLPPSSPIRKPANGSSTSMSTALFQVLPHHSAPHQVAAPLYSSPPPYKDCVRHSSVSELENGPGGQRRQMSTSYYGASSPAPSTQSSTATSSRATTPHGGSSAGGGDDDLYHANYRPPSTSIEPDGFFTYPKRKNQPERINLSSSQQVASKSSINKISNGSIDNISPSERSGTPVVATDGHRHSSCSLVGIVNRSGDSRAGTAPRKNPKPKIGDIRTIEVDKSTEPLGFQIEEAHGRGIFVSSVSQNSLAAEAGIEVGDQLLDVCGINMRGASYEQASRVLRQFGDMTIKMLLQFNPNRSLTAEHDGSSSVPTSSPSSVSTSLSPAAASPVQQSPLPGKQLKSPEHAPSSMAPQLYGPISPGSSSSSCGSVIARQSFRNSMHSREGSGVPDDLHQQPDTPRHVCLKWTPSSPGAGSSSLASPHPLGICLVGGNATGVFVNDIVPGSPAALAGTLRPGDQILELNGQDTRTATAERVLLELQRSVAVPAGSTAGSSESFQLLHLPPSSASQQQQQQQQQLLMMVHTNVPKWSKAREKRRGAGGDLFYVRALCSHDGGPGNSDEDASELPFEAGDLLLVDNTLHDNRLGRWHAWRVDENDVPLQGGTVPSRLRESLQESDDHQPHASSPQLRGHGSSSSSSGSSGGMALARRSFLRRRRHQPRNSEGGSSRDSRELASSELSMSTDSVPGIDECIPPMYQRMEKHESTILRPVIILGPFSDALVDKLTSESPDKYERCDMEIMKTLGVAVERGISEGVFIDYRKRDDLYEVVRKSAILDIASRNHHCMLLVGPAAIERLHRASIYPIVVYVKHKSAKQVREVKDPKFLPERLSSKSAKEMFERFQKVESDFKSHFSAVIPGSSMAAMCQCIKQAIDSEQKKKIWLPVN